MYIYRYTHQIEEKKMNMDTNVNNQDSLSARRAALSAALNKTVETFTALDEGSFSEAMSNGLLPIAEVVGIDRIAVYAYKAAEGGRRTMGQIYRWDRAEGCMVSLTEALLVLPDIPVVTEWALAMQRNECVMRYRNGGMSDEEALFLDTFGTRSIMLVPIFTHGASWGAVAFQNHTDGCDFSVGCVDLLYSAARLCAGLILRESAYRELEGAYHELEYSKNMADALNRAAEVFLSAGSERTYEEMMTVGIAPIVKAAELDRLSVWRNFTGDDRTLHSGQIYRWDRLSGGTTSTTPQIRDLPYHAFAPRWAEVLGRGESINSPVALLPEAPVLQSFGVVSAFVTPVLIGTEFWGFVLFEDRSRERYFDNRSAEMMRAAAFLCANTVIRAEMERNIAETNERLTEALKHANAASEAKGTFLSNMSHEMRTPLNTIIGMASIGKSTPSAERKDYALGRIEEASSHLLSVVNDVLDMSKIEAGKLELMQADFRFDSVLTKAVNSVILRMEQKGQHFCVAPDDSIPAVISGDEQRLTQVLINLLSNAAKFTPDGGSIKLTAKLESEENRVCTISVAVSDTGIGITRQQSEKLFHAFEQADSGMSRKYGGTGLGLAISKRIIEIMGGEIRLDSEAGKGSTFTFTFKAARSASIEELAVNQPDSETVPAGEFGGCRILLAEDVEINREILMVSMEGTGAEFDCAENGVKALQLLSENPDKYDLIFMDVQMPEMDGLEATEKIREAGNKIPIVAMTANVFREDIEKCLQAGMDDHIGKPLDMGKVIEKVRKYRRKN